MPVLACPHCGGKLAIGAVACFRCGRLVVEDRPSTGSQSQSGLSQTWLSDRARASLLEGRWLLKDPLRRGTSSLVWLAQDTSLDRPVEVKLLDSALLTDFLAVARFEREARLLVRLEHKNIVMLLASSTHEGVPFHVLKHLQGRTLPEHLHARGSKLTVEEAATLMAQLCEAVEVLHLAGVVHRDLQPRHVHVGDDGTVTLLDLGIAREENSQLTRAGELLGEVGYRAPEVTRGEAPTVRADLYSLGCLLYELVAGRPAFSGELTDVIAAGERPGEAPALEKLVPGVAPAFVAIVSAAMAPEPSARPASAVALRALLAPFGSPAPFVSPSAVPLVPVVARVPGADRGLMPPADVDVTPNLAREGVTEPMSVSSGPSATLVDSDSGPSGTMVDETPAPALLAPPADGTRVVAVPKPMYGPTRPLAAVPAARGRRGLWLVGALLALGLAALTIFSSREQLPPPATPIPRPSAEMLAVMAPAPVEKKEELIAKLSEDLEARRAKLPVVDPGHETVPPPPKLRAGKAFAPWRIGRRARGGPAVGSTAEVLVDAVFKNKPTRAQLEVDGVWKGVTPVLVELGPGDHAFKLDAPGTPLTEVTLGFTRGEHVQLEIELRTHEQAAMRSDPPAKSAKPE